MAPAASTRLTPTRMRTTWVPGAKRRNPPTASPSAVVTEPWPGWSPVPSQVPTDAGAGSTAKAPKTSKPFGCRESWPRSFTQAVPVAPPASKVTPPPPTFPSPRAWAASRRTTGSTPSGKVMRSSASWRVLVSSTSMPSSRVTR